MKYEFEAYLSKTFPSSTINKRYSHGGEFQLRFELGHELSNGSKERVEQATNRALEIFKDTFAIENEKLWLISYEYIGELEMYKEDNLYFNTLLPISKSTVTQFESNIKNGTFIDGEEEDAMVKISIALIEKMELNIRLIFEGIANLEMGLNPAIPQRIYFYSTKTNNSFHMYDDRGCWVCSDSSKKLKPVFEKYNSWLVECYRGEIEKQFE